MTETPVKDLTIPRKPKYDVALLQSAVRPYAHLSDLALSHKVREALDGLRSERQRRFVTCYAAHGNGTQAALESGYSTTDRCAAVHSQDLLQNPAVLKAIELDRERQFRMKESVADYVDRNLRQIAEVGTQQIPLADKDGNQIVSAEGVPAVVHVDARAANRSLELLCKRHGLIREVTEHTGTITLEQAVKQIEGQPRASVSTENGLETLEAEFCELEGEGGTTAEDLAAFTGGDDQAKRDLLG